MKLLFFKVRSPVKAIIDSLTDPNEHWDSRLFTIANKRTGVELWIEHGLFFIEEYRGGINGGLSFTIWEKYKAWQAVKVAKCNRIMRMISASKEESK